MRVYSAALLLVLGLGSWAARSQPTLRDSPDAERRTGNQSPAQPAITVTVTAPEPSPEKAAQEEQYRQREIVAQEDVRDFTRWLTYLTFLQAGIGLAGFWVANRASDAAKRSAELAEQAMLFTQRAFVHNDRFRAASITDPISKVKLRFDISWDIRNSGQTAAHDVDCVTEIWVVKPDEAETFAFPESLLKVPMDNGATLAPGAMVSSHPQPLKLELVAMLIANKAVLFICAYAEYRDVFPGTPKRTTQICARLRLLGEPMLMDDPFTSTWSRASVRRHEATAIAKPANSAV
jgi:hypothetical protein